MAAPAKPKLSKDLRQESMPLEQQIRKRAHEIWLQRGDDSGSALDDWLTAEREILGQGNQTDATKE